MHQTSPLSILIGFCYLLTNTAFSDSSKLNVLSYDLTIEPDLQKATVEGRVVINFETPSSQHLIALDIGDLQVDQVSGPSVRSFETINSQLIVQLTENVGTAQQITVNYHGQPARGLLFDPDLDQAHTVYFTSHWMVCHDNPGDKATLSLSILVPKGKDCIASGELMATEDQGGKTRFDWVQSYETPAYTYGFAIGNFNRATEQIQEVQLTYASTRHSEQDLKKVFKETGAILRFFEEKSGLSYVQNTYSQVLIGKNYQEMSGFSVLSTAYPTSVLKDSSEIHLTAHELAHQWWGNRITCKDFSHFWLNEAFAVYMASAFNEQRFGSEKYRSDISLYQKIYDGLVDRGKDHPLVFENWEPTRDNRHVVYYKGAYVLHLLREELGDKPFWKGIKLYSQQYVGRSVDTSDFKLAMEQAANLDLDRFFDRWVYH